MLALSLDLWLTLFNPVNNKHKALGLKVCVMDEPTTRNRFLWDINTVSGFTVWSIIVQYLTMATVTICKKLFFKTNYLSLAKRRGKQLTFPKVEKGKTLWFDDINKNVKYFWEWSRNDYYIQNVYYLWQANTPDEY